MVTTRRRINKLVRKVEKRIQKFYNKDAYFYISSATIYFGSDALSDELVCVAGRKTGETADGKNDYKQVEFSFKTMPTIVKSIAENAAVIALHAIDKLEEYPSFED